MHRTQQKTLKSMESPISAIDRVRKNGPRKPLRSLKELSDEFGVKYAALRRYLGLDENSPKARYGTGSSANGNRNTWYDPDEMRKWWKARNK